jgi:hypothetical protein
MDLSEKEVYDLTEVPGALISIAGLNSAAFDCEVVDIMAMADEWADIDQESEYDHGPGDSGTFCKVSVSDPDGLRDAILEAFLGQTGPDDWPEYERVLGRGDDFEATILEWAGLGPYVAAHKEQLASLKLNPEIVERFPCALFSDDEDCDGIEDVLYTPWPDGLQYEIKRYLESVASSHQSHSESAGSAQPGLQ